MLLRDRRPGPGADAPRLSGDPMSFARTLRLAAGCMLVAACARAGGPSPGAEPTVAPDEVREIVSALASDSMEGRLTGTPGSARASRFLADRMRSYGIRPA